MDNNVELPVATSYEEISCPKSMSQQRNFAREGWCAWTSYYGDDNKQWLQTAEVRVLLAVFAL